MGMPAARLGDVTSHGGTIILGAPTVLIGGMPAARIADMQVCPLITVLVPHVGGPITLGSSGVLIGGMPAARMNDMATCVGPPTTVALGCATVLIGEAGGGGGGGSGSGAAADAKMGAHSALVGEPGPQEEGPHWFESKFEDSAGNPVTGVHYEVEDVDGNKAKGVLTGDAVIKRGGLPDEGDFKVVLFSVFNAKWSTDSAKVGDVVTLSAEVEGFEDGTKAKIEIWEQDITGPDYLIEEIEATVDGGKIEAEWEYVYPEDREGTSSSTGEEDRYSSPEYYFFVHLEYCKTRSGNLKYEDSIEIEMLDQDDEPIPDEKYILYLSDGEVRKGNLDKDGYKKEEKVPPGSYKVEFPDIKE